MTALSNYLEQNLLDALYNNSSFTSLATVHVALFTTNPADDASGTEVSGVSYARKAVAAAAWNAAAVEGVGYKVTNNGAITFAAAGAGGWGAITHFAIFDAATVGNMYHFGALDATVTINENDVFEFADAALSLQLQ